MGTHTEGFCLHESVGDSRDGCRPPCACWYFTVVTRLCTGNPVKRSEALSKRSITAHWVRVHQEGRQKPQNVLYWSPLNTCTHGDVALHTCTLKMFADLCRTPNRTELTSASLYTIARTSSIFSRCKTVKRVALSSLAPAVYIVRASVSDSGRRPPPLRTEYLIRPQMRINQAPPQAATTYQSFKMYPDTC